MSHPFAVRLSKFDGYLQLGKTTIEIPQAYAELGYEFDLAMGNSSTGALTYAECVKMIDYIMEDYGGGLG